MEEANIQFELTGLDLGILVAYVIGVLAIGFWVGRKKEDQESFFLGGRGSHWFLIGFALMAANLSGTSYVGLAGAGYEDGISVWNYEWMATLVLCFFAVFILPYYLHSKISTMPEFLEKRYDARSRLLFSGFSIFTAMFIDSAGAMYAGAITLQLLFPDIGLFWLIVAIATLGGIYVLLGGLSAVMVTDTIQGILLLTAGGLIFFVAFSELGSWQAVVDAAPPDGFTVFKPADDDFLPWPGVFTGVLWLGIYYWITNHVVVQKVLSARNVNDGRWGALFCGLMQLPLLFLLILPGTMGRALYPDLPDPDMVWPAMAFDLLPVGLRGLVLAALVAALMSTLDSALNGTSSLVTNDFVRKLRPGASERRLLYYGRITIAVLMVLAVIWAPQIANFPTIVEYFQSFLGHITMPVVTVFLGGLFWRRATRDAAFYTLAVGIPVGITMFVLGEFLELYDLQFLYATGLLLLFSLLIFVGVTLLTPAPEADAIAELTWSSSTWHDETRDLAGIPWWQNYRYMALTLVIGTLAMVAFFT
ncbi:sodium:solute symporter family transporter [Leptolyngbya sp. KIOST-1]|uniref:sodium:solute symporter family transporter n=1 Tax=Leptolyngbya sp. KIOST-1 TaxID=1229172 RepID=UPI0005614456|nr:sodium/solute symporter [Leptolyngbya sp. KIOST-1]